MATRPVENNNMAAWRTCKWKAVALLSPRSRFIAKFTRNKHVLRHYAVITGNPDIDKSLDAITHGKAETWLKNYENIVGLTEVRDAQNKVIEVSGVSGRVKISLRKGTVFHGLIRNYLI